MSPSPHQQFLERCPESWTRRALSELGTIYSGGTPPREVVRYWGGDIPWLTPGELTTHSKKYISKTRSSITREGLAASGAVVVPAGALLVTTRATLGNRALAAQPMATNQGCKNLVLEPPCEPEFLWHLFELLAPELVRRASGTTFLEVSSKEFGDVDIALPPLEEQRQIAEILDSVDEAIQSNELASSKYVKLLEAVSQANIPRPRLASEASDGSLPPGWRFLMIDEIATNHDHRRIPIKSADRQRMKGKYRYYGASGVIDFVDDYLFDGAFVLLGEDGENVLSRQLPLAFEVSGKFWVNNHAHVLQPHPTIHLRYLVEVLEVADYSRVVKGSAQPKLTQADLRLLRFPVPEADEQERIVKAIDAVRENIRALQASAGKLRLVRHALAVDLLSGRVRSAVA